MRRERKQGLLGFAAVEQRFYGYQKLALEEYRRNVYNESGELFGIIYSFDSKNECHNFFKGIKKIELYVDENGDYKNRTTVNLLKSVEIGSEIISVRDNSYFITKDIPSEFYTEGKRMTVSKITN